MNAGENDIFFRIDFRKSIRSACAIRNLALRVKEDLRNPLRYLLMNRCEMHRFKSLLTQADCSLSGAPSDRALFARFMQA